MVVCKGSVAFVTPSLGAQPIEGSPAYKIQCYVTVQQEEAVSEKAAEPKKAAKPVKAAEPEKAAEKKTEVSGGNEMKEISISVLQKGTSARSC